MVTVIAGTVESNPQTTEASCLTISFHTYNKKGPIFYPPFDKVCAERHYFILTSFWLMFLNFILRVYKVKSRVGIVKSLEDWRIQGSSDSARKYIMYRAYCGS